MSSQADVLRALEPKARANIMDLVAAAGIDVAPWAVKADGTPAANPPGNPNYCYEWAFGGGNEPTLLCVWHENLRVVDDHIVYEDNVQEMARRLEEAADKWGVPREIRNRARKQAASAWEFDRKLQHAFRNGRPVRLVLLEGDQRDRNELGIDASAVRFRLLDPEPWHVHSYETSGPFRVLRQSPAPRESERDRAYFAVAEVSADRFADALLEVDARMTANQREMLVGHALAPDRTLSMTRIAALGGYDSYATANLQYGALGRMFMDVLGISGLANNVQVICELADAKDAEGHDQWTLREPVFQALQLLELIPAAGTLSEATGSNQSLAEESEIDAETPTQRKALIDARLGQGAYRRKMLRWWGGSCAVSGCSVERALVASHALPWRGSSSRQRLDHFNGLPLTGTLDRLFDAGLIAFGDDGSMVISDQLTEHDKKTLGLFEGMRLRKVDPRMVPYLQSHRKLHGL